MKFSEGFGNLLRYIECHTFKPPTRSCIISYFLYRECFTPDSFIISLVVGKQHFERKVLITSSFEIITVSKVLKVFTCAVSLTMIVIIFTKLFYILAYKCSLNNLL